MNRRLLLTILTGVTAVPTGPCQVLCGEGGCTYTDDRANSPPSVGERIDVQSRDPRNPVHGRTNDVSRVDWQTIYELRSFDPDGDDLLTEWDLNGDGSFEQGGVGETVPLGDPQEPLLPGERVTTYYHGPGVREVTARVTDFPPAPRAPAEVTRTRRVWVIDDAMAAQNSRPQVDFQVFPPSPRAGQETTVEATAVDNDPWEQELWYAWDFGLRDTYTGFSPDNRRKTYTWDNPGTYEVRLDVQDGPGANAILIKNVTVRDRNAPGSPPRASFVARPPAPMVGQQVTFDASGSTDAEGRIIRYQWDLDGDGTYEVTSSDPTTTTSYSSPGEKLVTLQVTDTDGDTDTEPRPVNVRPPALRLGASVFPAAAARLRFSARVEGSLRRGAGGRRASGRVRAQFVEQAGRGESRVARRLRRFFNARWQLRISRKVTRGSGRLTASGVALARPPGDRRSAACIRLRLNFVPGQVPAGRLTLLGGTGSAAGLRGSARFVFRLDGGAGGTVLGPISAREGRSRAMPRACRGLTR